MRNALAHAGKSGRRVVSAFIAPAFAQETPEVASAKWSRVADLVRPKVPKPANLIDHAENDVLRKSGEGFLELKGNRNAEASPHTINRNGLFQAQDTPAQAESHNLRRSMESRRKSLRVIHTAGVLELFQTGRIRAH
jgi:hypothetical protein